MGPIKDEIAIVSRGKLLSVDLPQPEGPMRAVTVPADTAARSGATPSELIFQIWTARASLGRKTFHGQLALARSTLENQVLAPTGRQCG
jgi:hypothetical protein